MNALPVTLRMLAALLLLTVSVQGAALRVSDYPRTNAAVVGALVEISAPSNAVYATRAITIGNLFTNANVLHVSMDGDDSLAQRGNWRARFRSVSNAVDKAQAGDIVFIWAGRYTNASFNLISNSFTSGSINVTNKTNLVVRGVGRATELYWNDRWSDGFLVKGCQNVSIEEMSLFGTRTPDVEAPLTFQCGGINVVNSERCTFLKLNFLDWQNFGICSLPSLAEQDVTNLMEVAFCHFKNIGSYYHQVARYDGAGLQPMSDWKIHHNLFEECSRGVEYYPINTATSRGPHIHNNRFKNMIWQGTTSGGQPSEGVVIENNWFSMENRSAGVSNYLSTDGYAVAIEGARGIVVRNNHFSGRVGGLQAIGITAGATNISIIGNDFSRCTRDIYVNNAFTRDVLISMNCSEYNSNQFVKVNAGQDINITLNTVSEPRGTLDVIEVISPSTNINTALNFFRGGASPPQYGIAYATDSSTNRNHGNIISGMSSAPYLFQSGTVPLFTDTAKTMLDTNLLVGSREYFQHGTLSVVSTNNLVASNAFMGRWASSAGFASWAHSALAGTGNSVALIQGSSGDTYLQAASGQALNFRLNGQPVGSFFPASGAGHFSIEASPADRGMRLYIDGNERVTGTNFVRATVVTNNVNAGSLTIGPSGGTITNILTGSATLDFASGDLETKQDLAITVAGAADGDVVEVGPPVAAMNAIGSFTGFASNGVAFVRFTPFSGGQDPGSGTFKVIVKKF